MPNLICSNCKSNIVVSDVTYNRYTKHESYKNKKFSCRSCINKNRWDSMSDEKRISISNKQKEIWDSYSKDDKIKRISKSHEWITQLSKDDKIKIATNASNAASVKYNNLSDEEREVIREKKRQWYKSLSDKDKLKISNNKKNWYNNLSPDEKENHRIRTIKQWDGYSDEQREHIINKRHSYWDPVTRKLAADRALDQWNNYPKERQEAIIDNLQKYYRSFIDKLSDDGKKAINIKQSDSNKQFWNLLSDDEVKNRTEHIRIYWESLSDEDKESIRIKQSNLCKDRWNDKTEEEKGIVRQFLEIIRNDYWANVSDEDKYRRSKLLSKKHKEWWDNLTIEQYNAWNMARSIKQATAATKLKDTEIEFINNINLYKLNYIYQYRSTIVDDNFYNDFSSNLSPYHNWDFKIRCADGNEILVDIDGSIHDLAKIKDVIVTKRDKTKISLFDVIYLNDLKRPYQTDGLPAFIIECYNDKLSNNNLVYSIHTDTYMTFKQFMDLITFNPTEVC